MPTFADSCHTQPQKKKKENKNKKEHVGYSRRLRTRGTCLHQRCNVGKRTKKKKENKNKKIKIKNAWSLPAPTL
jgi:hypothetical protein